MSGWAGVRVGGLLCGWMVVLKVDGLAGMEGVNEG